MSTWTHVAGCIRIDSLRIDPHMDFSIRKEILELLKTNLPQGSEGPIEYKIIPNPNTNSLAAYMIPIYGDLRDYDNIEEIENWFNCVCSRFIIRQAVLTIECENGQSKTITYKGEEE